MAPGLGRFFLSTLEEPPVLDEACAECQDCVFALASDCLKEETSCASLLMAVEKEADSNCGTEQAHPCRALVTTEVATRDGNIVGFS